MCSRIGYGEGDEADEQEQQDIIKQLKKMLVPPPDPRKEGYEAHEDKL